MEGKGESALEGPMRMEGSLGAGDVWVGRLDFHPPPPPCFSSSLSPVVLSTQGLGIIKGTIKGFDSSAPLSVPHIGWNGLLMQKHTKLIQAIRPQELVYFVHSYRAIPSPEAAPWALTLTTYGTNFISSVHQGRVLATQFHPEKSGSTGLRILRTFLEK
jgi:imidazole glycerol phosphate synthase glutamine amidotransferase subunit